MGSTGDPTKSTAEAAKMKMGQASICGKRTVPDQRPLIFSKFNRSHQKHSPKKESTKAVGDKEMSDGVKWGFRGARAISQAVQRELLRGFKGKNKHEKYIKFFEGVAKDTELGDWAINKINMLKEMKHIDHGLKHLGFVLSTLESSKRRMNAIEKASGKPKSGQSIPVFAVSTGETYAKMKVSGYLTKLIAPLVARVHPVMWISVYLGTSYLVDKVWEPIKHAVDNSVVAGATIPEEVKNAKWLLQSNVTPDQVAKLFHMNSFFASSGMSDIEKKRAANDAKVKAEEAIKNAKETIRKYETKDTQASEKAKPHT